MSLVKFIKKALAHVIHYPREYPFRNKDLLSRKEADDRIAGLLLADDPCFVARYGVVELNCVEEEYYLKRLPWRHDYTADLKKRCQINAGIFPTSKEFLTRFAKLYRKATKKVDLFCVWVNQPFEHFAIKKYSNCRTFAPLASVYTGVNEWTKALKGKKVLIVSAFTDTMKSQYEKRDLLFKDNPDLLPEMEIVFYKSVVSHGGLSVPFADWGEALMHMYQEISELDFDVALLGCGAYGLPLGDLIYRNMHKKVIHVGGSLQLLFGIKAKVYLDLEKDRLDAVINEHWVYPSQQETPPLFQEIDNGCYWK